MYFTATVQRTLWLAVVSTLFHHIESQFTELTLQSTKMPIDGDAWATYYDNDTNKIWLLSPRQCSNSECYYRNSVITYDIDHNIFENQTPILNSTSAMNGFVSQYTAVIGDEIYFNGEGGYIDKYNVKTREITKDLFNQQLRQGCLVADDRFLFIIGGIVMDSATSSAYDSFVVHDTFTNQWYYPRSLDLLWHARYLSCELVNGIIYTFGGDNGSRQSGIYKLEIGRGDDVLSNMDIKQWSQIGDLNVERANHNSVRCDNSDNNLIYIIGGRNTDNYELSIEIFDVNTETIETATFALNDASLNPVVVCLDNYIYIFGGRTSWSGSTTDSWKKSNELYSSSPTTSPTMVPTQQSIAPSVHPSNSLTTNKPTNQPSASPSNHPSKTPSYTQSTSAITDYMYTSNAAETLPSTPTEFAFISGTDIDTTETLTMPSTLNLIFRLLISVTIVFICICVAVVICNRFILAKQVKQNEDQVTIVVNSASEVDGNVQVKHHPQKSPNGTVQLSVASTPVIGVTVEGIETGSKCVQCGALFQYKRRAPYVCAVCNDLEDDEADKETDKMYENNAKGMDDQEATKGALTSGTVGTQTNIQLKRTAGGDEGDNGTQTQY